MTPPAAHPRRRLLTVTLCVALAACAGPDFSWEQARQLKTGMTPAQVEAIMGPPNNVRSTPTGMTWVWVWVNLYAGTRTLAVVFENGVLTKVPDLPAGYK